MISSLVEFRKRSSISMGRNSFVAASAWKKVDLITFDCYLLMKRTYHLAIILCYGYCV